jgi:hypothetical protein
MPYCPRCGVETDRGVASCPLCSTEIPRFNEGEDERRYPERRRYAPLSGAQKRFMVWLAVTMLFLTSFLVVLTVNLVAEGRITWGSYALAGIGAGWIYISLLLLFIRKASLIIAGNFIVTAGFLALIDVFDGSLDWFLRLGLPIAGMVTAASLLMALFVSALKRWPALVCALALIVSGVVCVGLDLLVSGYRGSAGMTWSFIVMVALYPLAGLFLAYHVFLRKRIDPGRYFHL